MFEWKCVWFFFYSTTKSVNLLKRQIFKLLNVYFKFKRKISLTLLSFHANLRQQHVTVDVNNFHVLPNKQTPVVLCLNVYSYLYYFPSKATSDNVDTVNKVRGHVSCLQNIMVAMEADVWWFSSVSVAQVTRNKICRSKINYDHTIIFE